MAHDTVPRVAVAAIKLLTRMLALQVLEPEEMKVGSAAQAHEGIADTCVPWCRSSRSACFGLTRRSQSARRENSW